MNFVRKMVAALKHSGLFSENNIYFDESSQDDIISFNPVITIELRKLTCVSPVATNVNLPNR